MKRIFMAMVFLAGMLLPSLAPAADVAVSPRLSQGSHVARMQVLPFPRSERAQSVWASNTCWSECGAYCAWGMAACLERDSQGQCLKRTDSCDRACLRHCRTSGGPLVPDIFDF